RFYRVRSIALALPGVNERFSHGAPCFFVRDQRTAALLPRRSPWRWSNLIVVSRLDVQQELVTAEPDRFFEPPASGSGTFSTWLGVHLDLPGDNVVDWDEIAAILRDAYRLVAPK